MSNKAVERRNARYMRSSKNSIKNRLVKGCVGRVSGDCSELAATMVVVVNNQKETRDPQAEAEELARQVNRIPPHLKYELEKVR